MRAESAAEGGALGEGRGGDEQGAQRDAGGASGVSRSYEAR